VNIDSNGIFDGVAWSVQASSTARRAVVGSGEFAAPFRYT